MFCLFIKIYLLISLIQTLHIDSDNFYYFTYIVLKTEVSPPHLLKYSDGKDLQIFCIINVFTFQACTNTSKIPNAEKRGKREHVVVQIRERLMEGKWSWYVYR